MDMLKKYVKLGSRVALYVPGTIDINHASDTSEWVASVSLAFSQMFGGCTASACAGYWEDDCAGLVTENVTVVYSYTDTETLKKTIDKVLQLAHSMKKSLNQSAVTLEVNRAIYFI